MESEHKQRECGKGLEEDMKSITLQSGTEVGTVMLIDSMKINSWWNQEMKRAMGKVTCI